MDDDKRNLVRVNIYGHEYSIKAVADSQYITDVASYVDQRMRETELNLKDIQSPIRVAILAAMSITDELLTERRKGASSLEQIEERAVRASNLLDDVLETSFRH